MKHPTDRQSRRLISEKKKHAKREHEGSIKRQREALKAKEAEDELDVYSRGINLPGAAQAAPDALPEIRRGGDRGLEVLLAQD